METDEFLRRCEEIEEGLHELADDLFSVAEGEDVREKEQVISRSKEKVKQYEAFLGELDDSEDVEEANSVLEHYIQRLKKNLERVGADA